jgi:hypothetical protein
LDPRAVVSETPAVEECRPEQLEEETEKQMVRYKPNIFDVPE